MCQRFLYISVLPQGDGVGGHARVGVVGCRHQDGIDGVSHLVEHFPPVFKLPGLWMIAECLCGIFPVHVAKGYDVLRFHVGQVAAPHAPNANTRNIELVAGSHMAKRFT